MRTASTTSNRAAASHTITFEIPGSRPIEISAVAPASSNASLIANCSKIPGVALGSLGPAAATSR